MAGNTQTNATAVKLGNGFLQANAGAAKSTTKVEDNGRLPAGIENGVARVVSMKIQPIAQGKQNAGKPMFVAQAVVVKPEYVDGVKVAGRRTSMMEMLFDTPGKKRATVKDHVEHVYSYLRTIGVDTNMLAAAKTEDELRKKLDAVFALLVTKKTTISFRTWKGSVQTTGPYAGKEPLVNETWGGPAQVAADTTPPEANVRDDSPPAEDVPADDVVDDTDAGDDVGTAGDGALSDEDVDALVAVADGDEEGQEKDDAGVRLEDWCKATNPALEDEGVRARATNWAELVAWARDGVPDDSPTLAVGAVVKYKVPAAGPGKPAKVVQCEVKKLYKVKGVEVADLLNLTDKKTKYNAVPADKLEAA